MASRAPTTEPPDGDDDDRIATRARACLGARFRPHGRSVDHGLDCVGLAALAFVVEPPAGYALRGGTVADIEATIAALGFARASGGPLLLLAAGPHQRHLAVATGTGFVHADAGLRRVVEVPGAPRWPVISRWHREG